jgi:membrane protease YdiL (CAAX protease family)
MAVDTLSSPVAADDGRGHLGRILVGCALMFVVLQGGLNVLLPHLDLTWSSLIVTASMFAVAFAVEGLAFDRTPRQALAALGFGRPQSGALLAAAIIAAAMISFFPIYSLVTGTPFSLRSDWPWVLVGAIALNGLAEETLFRGFVFGHLRQAGDSFRRAGVISLLIFGAVHLYLFTSNPFVVAMLATVLAVAAAFPFAFLYERAGMVIWAGVIVHTAAHAFRLVDMPEGQTLTVASIWILVQFGAVFLVFAFRHDLLRQVDSNSSPG